MKKGETTEVVKNNGEQNWKVGFWYWSKCKDVLEKTKNLAVQVADQNDDGKFDMEDVSVMASSFGDAVKKEHIH